MGLIGTLIGLVNMLSSLEDPTQIGAGMATADDDDVEPRVQVVDSVSDGPEQAAHPALFVFYG